VGYWDVIQANANATLTEGLPSASPSSGSAVLSPSQYPAGWQPPPSAPAAQLSPQISSAKPAAPLPGISQPASAPRLLKPASGAPSAPSAVGGAAGKWAGPAASGAIAGGLDAARRVGAGQPLPQALGGGAITGTGAAIGTGIGAGLGAGLGTLAGPAGTWWGGVLGGAAGGYIGGAIGGAIADALLPIPSPTGGNGTHQVIPIGSTGLFTGGQSSGVGYFFDYVWSGSAPDVPKGVQTTGPRPGPFALEVAENPGADQITYTLLWAGGSTLLANVRLSSDTRLANMAARRADGQPDVGGNPLPPPETEPRPTHAPAPTQPQYQRPIPGSNPGPQPSPAPTPAPAPSLPSLPKSNLPGGNPILGPQGIPASTPAPAPAPTKPDLGPQGIPAPTPSPSSPSSPGSAPGSSGGGSVSGSPRGGADPQTFKESDAPNGFEILPNGTKVQLSPTPKDWDSAQPALKPKPSILSGSPRAAAPTPTYAEPTERPGTIPDLLDAASPILPGLGIRPDGKIGETPKTQSGPQPPPGGNGSGGCEIGGCGSQTKAAVDRVDSKLDTLLGGINAGANSAQLALLNTINTKLGAQIPNGGIGAFLLKMQSFAEKAWRTTRMDKLINALTLITVLHNGAMLSRNLAQTLGDVIGQALAIVGIKDENDSPIDINELVGKGIQDFLQDLLGEPVYKGISDAWRKANTIISTASQILWNVRSLIDATQSVLEIIGENVSRIGNALRKWGVVGGNSYGWMSENMTAPSAFRQKLDRVNLTIGNAEDLGSSLEGVTGNILEGQEELNQLIQNTAKLHDQINNKNPIQAIENIPKAQAAAAAKAASPGQNLAESDLEADNATT
jgi:hypothetical protein